MFIKDMLREELQNSLQIKADYQQAIDGIPRGSLVRKIIGGHPYFYLAYREQAKVKFDYVGKLSEEEIHKYQESKEKRAKYRKHLSEVNKQIKYIEKVLRAK
jgi:hypothetical protein